MTNSKLSFGLGRGEVWLDLQRSAKERALVKERDSRLQQDNSRLQVPLVFLRKKSARPATLSHVGKPFAHNVNSCARRGEWDGAVITPYGNYGMAASPLT